MATITNLQQTRYPYTINARSSLNNMTNIFEQVINTADGEDNLRDCRAMQVPDNYNPGLGNWCEIITAGSGYSQWYHYMSLQGQHYLIFRSYIRDNWVFTWRHIDNVPTSFGFDDSEHMILQ